MEIQRRELDHRYHPVSGSGVVSPPWAGQKAFQPAEKQLDGPALLVDLTQLPRSNFLEREVGQDHHVLAAGAGHQPDKPPAAVLRVAVAQRDAQMVGDSPAFVFFGNGDPLDFLDHGLVLKPDHE